jgi:hypothetical protein
MTYTKCINCQNPFTLEGIKAVGFSGLCESCFDKLFDQAYDGLIDELKTREENV